MRRRIDGQPTLPSLHQVPTLVGPMPESREVAVTGQPTNQNPAPCVPVTGRAVSWAAFGPDGHASLSDRYQASVRIVTSLGHVASYVRAESGEQMFDGRGSHYRTPRCSRLTGDFAPKGGDGELPSASPVHRLRRLTQSGFGCDRLALSVSTRFFCVSRDFGAKCGRRFCCG
jgi:hypothetical protein